MNVFKLATGPAKVMKIEPLAFESGNFKRPPHVNYNKQGTPMFFAVCPRCDNPIQIIGLHKMVNPYGRHYPQSIPGLAEYDQESYNYCPYARPQIPSSTDVAKKSKREGLPQQILNLLREQFDRVIYLLSKDTGVLFSLNLARAMLDSYLRAEGFLYVHAALTNLPWAFAYMTISHSLYGQIIKAGTPLRDALKANFPDADFENNGRFLMPKGGPFIDVNFCFINHVMKTFDDCLVETFDFVVSEGFGTPPKEVYRKTITVDQAHFLNLINMVDVGNRNRRLLDIAQDLIP